MPGSITPAGQTPLMFMLSNELLLVSSPPHSPRPPPLAHLQTLCVEVFRAYVTPQTSGAYWTRSGQMTISMSPAGLCSVVRKSIDPTSGLRNPYDAIASLTHACMLTSGFVFVGLGEDHTAKRPIRSDDVSTLPSEWNASTSSTYQFRYTHDQLLNDYLLRVSRLGAKTLVFGASVSDDKTCSFEVSTAQYTSGDLYPWSATENKVPLIDAFISMSRVKEFSSLFIASLFQKVLPQNLEDEDSTEGQEKVVQPLEGRAGKQVRPADPSVDPLMDQPRQGHDPLRYPPRSSPRPSDWPPEFEDEHQMQSRGRGGGIRLPPGGPSGIGADDLRPPGIDAMNPFGRSGGHRGMHPTPEDIMFPDRGDDQDPSSVPGRPPAGARYDPVFPGDRNDSRGGRGLGHGGFNQFGGMGGFNDDSMYG